MATPYYSKFETDAKLEEQLKFIKSNESLSLAQRKGDVLYGILDQYTGEEITLSKVTGTPTVDGIIYFQLGSEYFKRNFKDGIKISWFAPDETVSNIIKETNQTYIIDADKDLLTTTFNVPKNVVLDFTTGSITNGTLNCDNNLFTNNVKLVGTIVTGVVQNISCNIDWFVDYKNNETDNTNAIKNAFKSVFATIELSKVYSINSPIELPYNKLIKGRTSKNNKLSGFQTLDTFTSQTITFPLRDGIPTYSKVVYGMFYHRDTTALVANDVLFDARYKSKYCIEHIDLYGNMASEKCYFTGAYVAAVLQYAAEQPYWKDCNFYANGIGIYASSREINESNPIVLSGANKGVCNIIAVEGCYLTSNNYGVILDSGTDINLLKTTFGYNSILAAQTSAVNTYINGCYTEVDGTCKSYVSSSGFDNGTDGVAHPTLVAANKDGISVVTGSDLYQSYYKVKTYYRAPFVNKFGKMVFDTNFLSIKARSFQTINVSTVELPTERTAAGIDSWIINLSTEPVIIKNCSEYSWSVGSGKSCMYVLVHLSEFSYSKLPKFSIELLQDNISNVRNQNKVVHIGVGSNTPENHLNEYKNNIQGVNFADYNNFQNNAAYLFNGGNDFNLARYFQKETKFIENYQGWNLYEYKVGTSYVNATFDVTKLKDVEFVEIYVMMKTIENGGYGITTRLDGDSGLLIGGVQSNDGGSTIPDFTANGYFLMKAISPIKSFGDVVKWLQVKVRMGGTNANLISQPRVYALGDPNGGKLFLKEDEYIMFGTTAERPITSKIGSRYFDTTLGYDINWNGTVWVNSVGSTV
jgi:hypothetical protein